MGESNLQSGATGLSSQVVLLEREGRFFVYQPAFGLIASGDSVATAYQKFADAQRLFLDDVRRAGLTVATAVQAPVEASVAVHRGFLAELGLFVAKFVLVLLVLAGAGGMAVGALENAVSGIGQAITRVVNSAGSLTLNDAVTKSEDIVRDFNNLPANRKEELRRNVGEISRQLTPIIDAWRNPPTSPDAR